MSLISDTPFKINNMELKNRIIMLVMQTGFAKGGKISEQDMAFFEERAKGGAAAITQVCGVSEYGAANSMPNVKDETFTEREKALTDMIHSYDTKHIVQLFHRGRNSGSDYGLKPLAPSNVPSSIYRNECEVMTKAQIEETIKDFADAALKCKEIGVDAVEVSCSAGYLLTLFLSPLTNLRDDEYGGDDERRMKMPLDTLRAVRAAVGKDYPVIVRIAGSQMMPGGYGIDYMQKFCSIAEKEGLIDAVNVTGGWHEAPVPQISYQLPAGGFAYLADAIKRVVNVPVIACNRINNIETIEEILSNGMADFVGTARGFLADPAFAEKVLTSKSYNRCQGCNKCIEAVLKGKQVVCAYNPEVGHEAEEKTHRMVRSAKKILIVGAGPAGLEAAKKSAERGYKTILCTKDGHLGGMLVSAAVPPEKQDLIKFVENKKYELEQLGVDIRYDTEVDGEFVKELEPYFVIEASGGEAVIPPIKGIDGENVYMALDVLNGGTDIISKLKKGSTVIIGGGSVGLETARFLASKHYATDKSKTFNKLFVGGDIPTVDVPSDITVVEMTKKIGRDLGGLKWIVMKEVKSEGIKTMTETKIKEIGDGFVIADTPEGEVKLPADNVIVAAGFAPAKSDIALACLDEKISYTKIGDCAGVGDAMKGIHEAYGVFLRVFIA
ncbi:MAG: NAD(P)/FAD-dependent oxidoreductase [Clostridiales bacterium]|nr:NAD(P)/FAD-dependent oxidoreductase [Clostridiales bacterium]